MNAIKTIFATLIFIATANAQALCVNQDGSLDDVSMTPSTVAVEMLPMCEAPKAEPKAAEKKVAVAIAPVTADINIPYIFGAEE